MRCKRQTSTPFLKNSQRRQPPHLSRGRLHFHGRQKMYLRVAILGGVLLLAAGVALGSPAEVAPQWLQQAAAIKVPTYDKEVTAVVLRTEENIVLNSDGRLITNTIYAVRILSREGRGYADAVEMY